MSSSNCVLLALFNRRTRRRAVGKIGNQSTVRRLQTGTGSRSGNPQIQRTRLQALT